MFFLDGLEEFPLHTYFKALKASTSRWTLQTESLIDFKLSVNFVVLIYARDVVVKLVVFGSDKKRRKI